MNKTQAEYRELFLHSEQMRKKLRRLTHQMIAANEAERRKIGRKLHDDIAQILIAVGVDLAGLGRAGALRPRVLQTTVARLQRLQEKAVRVVHRFARGLRPAVLDHLGLIPALQAHLAKLAARKKLLIRLTAFAAIETLDEGLRSALYRVTQEALAGVVRHTRAREIHVVLSRARGVVRLEVNDNGKAFPALPGFSSRTGRWLGLAGIRERVELRGGTLSIASAPGQGAAVRVEIPLAGPRRA